MFSKAIHNLLLRPYLSLLTVLCVVLYGWFAQRNISVDAIPNIGQNQVIVLTKWEGQSPKDVEDQITYPLSVTLLAVPHAESVRGKSLFGFSFVQITFPDSTDYYWARSRVSEQIATAKNLLPEGVNPVLGPDSTGLGQILYYTLQSDEPVNPVKLRSIQDYVVKYALQAVEGVSEVASIGGYKKEYQIDLDPDKLRFHNVPLAKIISALKDSNKEVGAKTIEQSGMEFIIRGKGFLGGGKGSSQTLADLESAVVSSKDGVPLRIKDIADVTNGTGFRRGGLDLNGAEAVGGIVVMRMGSNPRTVIEGIKEKIKELEPSLGGVKVVPVYDRTTLIDATIATLSDALLHEILITILVIVFFLLHLKTSLIVATVLPFSVCVCFIIMRHIGLDANIMSLAGIAIAIGNMVDISIVITENIYQKLSENKQTDEKERIKVITSAVKEVTPALLTATLTTVIGFLPVFFLTGRDHKLFAPLAMTKTFALVSALVVSIVVVPLFSSFLLKDKMGDVGKKALPLIVLLCCVFSFYQIYPLINNNFIVCFILIAFIAVFYFVSKILIAEKFRPIEENRVAQNIYGIYRPLLCWAIGHRKLFFSLPVVFMGIGLFSWQGAKLVLNPMNWAVDSMGYNLRESKVYRSMNHAFPGLKSDDWIALDEGSLFYMPTMYPGISFSKAFEVLQVQNNLIKKIPEVKDVLGKIGRSDSALDPAPTAMIETYITLKDKSEWRDGVTKQDIWKEVTKRASLPGVTPAAYLQPIEGRVVMLQSGIRASMAIRIYGSDLKGLAEASENIAKQLKLVEAVNPLTVNPDIVLGKPYLEFEVDRQTAARYGMSVGEVNQLIATALGGNMVGLTVEGRERYAIRLRYQREYRDHLERLEKLPVVTPKGEVIPLKVLAKMETLWGPAGISSENARLVAHVSFAPSGNMGSLETIEEVMESLKHAQATKALSLPEGYNIKPVGSFQNQIEANRTLMWIIPIVIMVNLFIIYLMFQSWSVSLLIFTGIPLSFGGGMLSLLLNGVEINTAIWVGFIALFGIAVDNGVILCSYLNDRFRDFPPKRKEDVVENVIYASMKRIRPCLMTTATTIIALTPVLMATGKGAEIAKGMALPIFGGMFSSLLVLLVLPVMYCEMKEKKFSQ